MAEPMVDEGVARRSVDGQLFGVLLLVFGGGWLLRTTGAWEVPWTSLLSVVLIVLGVGLVVTPWSRRHVLIYLGVALTVVLAVGSAVRVPVGGVGESTRRPLAFAAIPAGGYKLGAGSLTLDLTDLESHGTEPIRAEVGLGEIKVVVPDGVPIHFRGEVGLGHIVVFGEELGGGAGVGEQYSSPDAGDEDTLVLDLEVGIGQIRVVREDA